MGKTAVLYFRHHSCYKNDERGEMGYLGKKGGEKNVFMFDREKEVKVVRSMINAERSWNTGIINLLGRRGIING